MNFLENMRERPEDERVAFAVIAAGTVAVVLFVIWGFTFFRGSNNTTIRVEGTEQSASVSESFRNASAQLSGAAEEFSVQYQQLQAALDEVSEAKRTVVDLQVDDNGDVQVNTITVPAEELQ